MICPAILDPFQGANYRLIACMHQALLCPIISKVLGYTFSRSAGFEDIVVGWAQAKNYNTLDDTSNGTKACTKSSSVLHNEIHVNNINGKPIKNGCDTGNNLMGESTISSPNDSNKKIQ